MTAVYPDLRRLAAHYLRHERPGHTLQPTALVHELYLRLPSGEPVECRDRAHFLALAAQQLRRLVIDNAREHHAEKRGGDRIQVPLSDAGFAVADSEVTAGARPGAEQARSTPYTICSRRRVALLRGTARRRDRRIARHIGGNGQAGLGIRARVADQPARRARAARIAQVVNQAWDRRGFGRLSSWDRATEDASVQSNTESSRRLHSRHLGRGLAAPFYTTSRIRHFK